MDTMQRMKKMHEGEIAVLRNEKKDLRDQIQVMEDRIANNKQQFQEELKRKEDKLRSEKKPEDEKEK